MNGERTVDLIRRILGRFGQSKKSSKFFMNQNPAYAGLQIGDWTYGNPTVPRCLDGATLRIGRFCAIASGVTILTGLDHRADWISTYHFHLLGGSGPELPYASRTKGDVIIGHDVWIGVDALVLSGVSIGNGAVVAARSVVTKDVPAYAIVAGVPAKIVRYRFDPATIEALESIAWWDWPIERIKEAAPMLMSSDMEAFLRQYGPRDKGEGGLHATGG